MNEDGKNEVDLGDMVRWDDRRQELLTMRHNLGRSLFVDVNAWGFTLRIFRVDAPKVFADMEASVATELAELEAKFAGLGIIPSEWTAPEGGEGL